MSGNEELKLKLMTAAFSIVTFLIVFGITYAFLTAILALLFGA